MPSEWTKPQHVEAYLSIKDSIPHRSQGEQALLAEIPTSAQRILDLGCGDGHLLSLVLEHCPQATGVGLDMSLPMLARAETRFDRENRVSLIEHDLGSPLPELGMFDCVVSSFAIHHCTHVRKQELCQEIYERLLPGGVFCNLEHVSSPTPELHARFMAALGLTADDEDPSNRLLDVETQLNWIREAGFCDVDCLWKWRELALLHGNRRIEDTRPDAVDRPVKQVIVVRHDLKMRRGKQIAQGAHAAMAFLTDQLRRDGVLELAGFDAAAQRWLQHSFAKECCRVNSEEELLALYQEALGAGLEVHMIVDSGKTEFHGRPTRTCLAIGPADSERIDQITGHLELL